MNVRRNTRRMLIPEASTISASSTPARMSAPSRVRLSRSHRPMKTSTPTSEHEQAEFRIEDAELDDGALQERRYRHRERVAAPNDEGEIVQHERDTERQQHLAKLEASDEPQQSLIEHETAERNRRHRGNGRQGKAAGASCNGVADIAAQQIQRAMREVDDAQQPENQREAGRHHEQECRKGQPVEKLEERHRFDARRGEAAASGYQSRICSPVQNTTSRCRRMRAITLRKYLRRCGAPMM